MPKILVIIPAYNEQENIVKLMERLFDLIPDVHILVVDDGQDKTAELVLNKQKTAPNLFLIKRTGKLGRGTAVLEGLRFGLAKDYEYLVEMDADFSHNPTELPTLLEAAAANRLVIGSRYVVGSKIINWPLKRRIFSRLANFYANLILGIGINDYTNGYRVYGREAAKQLDFNQIKAAGYVVLSEIAYQLFLKKVEFKEVPTVFVNRQRGASNFSLKEISESFKSVLSIRRRWGKKL